MSTSSSTGSVGVHLGDHDPVAVGLQHVGDAGDHDVVVVHDGDLDG